eukprot:5777305-Pleurochrysis_carterae.AAC.1
MKGEKAYKHCEYSIKIFRTRYVAQLPPLFAELVKYACNAHSFAISSHLIARRSRTGWFHTQNQGWLSLRPRSTTAAGRVSTSRR